jgi:hypothetical protein
MRYDLMDTETGNLYDRFPSEETALAFVRALIEANGTEIADTLMLGGRDAAGRVLPVQTGAALARRAENATTDGPPLSRRAS